MAGKVGDCKLHFARPAHPYLSAYLKFYYHNRRTGYQIFKLPIFSREDGELIKLNCNHLENGVTATWTNHAIQLPWTTDIQKKYQVTFKITAKRKKPPRIP